MHSKLSGLFLALLCIAAPVRAQDIKDFSYTYVEAGLSLERDSFGVSTRGIGLSGSVLIKDRFFLAGSFAELETDNTAEDSGGDGRFQISAWSLGAYGRHEMSLQTDLIYGLRLLSGDSKGEGDSAGVRLDAEGFGLDLGLRYRWREGTEFQALVSRTDTNTAITVPDAEIPDLDLTSGRFSLGVLHQLTDYLWVRASYSAGDSAEGVLLGLRFAI